MFSIYLKPTLYFTMKHGSHHKQGARPQHITDEALRNSQKAKIEAQEPRINEHVDLMPVRKREKLLVK